MNLPIHPLKRIRDFLRASGFQSAATRQGLSLVLGISRSVLGSLESQGKPFSPAQREVVAAMLDIDPVWLLNATGPIRASDGGAWRPELVPALVRGRTLVPVVTLASSIGLDVLKMHLQAEARAGRPGPATFGILKLASELDPSAVAKAASKP